MNVLVLNPDTNTYFNVKLIFDEWHTISYDGRQHSESEKLIIEKYLRETWGN